MANYDYTVVTAQGDVQLTTTSHHSEHDSINKWISAHRPTINATLAAKRVKVLAVYSAHSKSDN